MTRAKFLISLAPAVSAAQMLMMGEASEGFVSLFNGQDMGHCQGDPAVWKVERSLLIGKAEGEIPSSLLWKESDYGDFELRLELRVRQGAVCVQMRAPGVGPLGVGVEFAPPDIRWKTNGSPFTVIANQKLGEWGAYRIISKGANFDFVKDDIRSTIVAGHVEPRGKLAFILPAGIRSDIEFRNIRLKL